MFIADLHIHSKYSRATSRDCSPEILSLTAARKGLHLLGTGDFTHPIWRQELREKLLPAEEGLYTLAKEYKMPGQLPADALEPRFIISGEIASIYKHDGKVRKVHNMILLPSLDAANKLSGRLELIGNLHSDGRPILGLSSHDLLEITLEACAKAIFIPAHIWTPHFSLFGAYSGFDDLRECFGDLSGHIHALEMGLSSDPPMNWRLSALDNYTLLSNSDAHSPAKLAREASIFSTELTYSHIAQALREHCGKGFYGNIKFFPEEGKYHYDGHRNCGICFKPAETKAHGGICPVCGGRITVGVLSRVEELADRPEGFKPSTAKSFESLVPLAEVIAASAGFSAISQRGQKIYGELLNNLGTELFVLRQASLSDIENLAGSLVAEGIRRLRAREVTLTPGYDGVFGKISLLNETERQRILGQTHLFGGFMAEDKPNKNQQGQKNTKESVKPTGTAEAIKKKQPSLEKETNLNNEQLDAAKSPSPVIAVIAGPGTGKTRTLVSRIVYLLREGGVKPAHITAVTFTNKAALQMRQRLEQELQNKRMARAVNIGTFHAICLRLLRAKPNHTGVTLLNEADALLLMADILLEYGSNEPPRDILRRISLHKNGAGLDGNHGDIPRGIFEEYQKKLRDYGVLDYDDILLEALALASDNNKCFTHLLVDEFQDINRLQYSLLQSWGHKSTSIFVIGDPHQSIYGFRGSAKECFSWFYKDYPTAKLVQLNKNYRSTPQIIACAAAALTGKQDNLLPQMATGQDNGIKVRLLLTYDGATEALSVTKEIKRLVGGLDMLESGRQPYGKPLRGFADIAVLYRINRQAALFERFFKAEGIPYTIAGREEYLTDSQVINTLAFFRLLLNHSDQLARRRCQQNLGEQRFEELWKKYQPLAHKSKPGSLMKEWLADNGQTGCGMANDNTEISLPLEMLAQAAVLYDSMTDFLHNLALGSEADVLRSGAGKRERQAVSLMTLHAAKGLEFPVVFLVGAEEGLFPGSQSIGEPEEMEEERRLCYVALTRAMERIYVSHTKQRMLFGKTAANLLSRFIDEIGDDNIDRSAGVPRR
ncbi:MAG: UvrD-helicase domain-containing protein, partial [Clostridiales bacterium]|nr:UvrD-helicase domain-containing protein [Clostridiales bacterium]